MLPRCTACVRTGSTCEQEDRNRNTLMLRSTIDDLVHKLSTCEALLKQHIPNFTVESLKTPLETAPDPFININASHFSMSSLIGSSAHSAPFTSISELPAISPFMTDPLPTMSSYPIPPSLLRQTLDPRPYHVPQCQQIGSSHHVPLLNPVTYHQVPDPKAVDPRSNDLSNIKVRIPNDL
jgi:hypothetical protein